MKTIELVGQVDEQHRLSADVPSDVPPGLVKLTILLGAGFVSTGEDRAGEHWEAGIAREWAEDLGDEQQDIYTLSDGEAVNETR